jgi:hypothetical protein
MKGWGLADLAAELRDVKTVDVAFEIERDWSGGWGLTLRACRACDAARPDSRIATAG